MIDKSEVHSFQQHRAPRTSPNRLLEKTCGLACLKYLPWLDMSIRSGEREFFEAWVKQQSVSSIQRLHVKEKKTFTASGPQGLWTLHENKFGRWWRPHKLDEVFVEIMYPIWNRAPAKTPSYLIVISSGPIGACAVFLDDKFQYLITERSETWLQDVVNKPVATGEDGIKRYSA